MNYQKIYEQITANDSNADYTEQHHILPRSLGGTDDPPNIVRLTAREHFICHWLLTKMYPDNHSMIMALQIMKGDGPYQDRYDTPITSRVFENIRIQVGKAASERNKGRVQPQHEKEKQVAAQTGRKRKPFTEEWKANLSKNHKSKQPGYNGTLSDKTKRKMSEKATDRKQSAETIKKKADAVRGSKREKKHCPHCDRIVAVNGYARWHGDKCKHKT